jgi:hypothetical protein
MMHERRVLFSALEVLSVRDSSVLNIAAKLSNDSRFKAVACLDTSENFDTPRIFLPDSRRGEPRA